MCTAVVSTLSMSDGISRCTGPGIAPVAARIAPRSISAARSGRATILFQRVRELCSGSWSKPWLATDAGIPVGHIDRTLFTPAGDHLDSRSFQGDPECLITAGHLEEVLRIVGL